MGPRILRADTAALDRAGRPSISCGATSDEQDDPREACCRCGEPRAGGMHDVAAGALRHRLQVRRARSRGRADGARHHRARAMSAIDVDGASIAMTVRMPAETIPVRPSRPDLPPPKASAFPVTTCEATIPAQARTRASVDGRSAAAAQGGAQARRAARRHRLPHRVQLQRLPVLRRSHRVAVRARRQRGRRDAARPRHPRRRLSLSRKPVRPRAPRLLRQPVGLRLRRVAGRFLPARRASCSPPRRGSSSAATTNRATAPGRGGGGSSIRGR